VILGVHVHDPLGEDPRTLEHGIRVVIGQRHDTIHSRAGLAADVMSLAFAGAASTVTDHLGGMIAEPVVRVLVAAQKIDASSNGGTPIEDLDLGRARRLYDHPTAWQEQRRYGVTIGAVDRGCIAFTELFDRPLRVVRGRDQRLSCQS
jgi:hypothetical protein